MVKLIANRRMNYATRRLLADDTFEAPLRDARVLIAVRRARLAPIEPEVIAPDPEAEREEASEVEEMSEEAPAAQALPEAEETPAVASVMQEAGPVQGRRAPRGARGKG